MQDMEHFLFNNIINIACANVTEFAHFKPEKDLASLCFVPVKPEH